MGARSEAAPHDSPPSLRSDWGHRIRIALSNSYWPMLWPSPRTAALTLTLAGSALSLPSPTGTQPWTGFAAADGAPPLRRHVLRPATFERTIERDVARGRTVLTVADRSDVERTEAHGLETWSETSRRYLIADDRPDQAGMTIERKLGIGRGDWRATTEVAVDFSGTEETFRWSVSLSARVGGRRLAHRRFTGEVDRSRGTRDNP